MAKTSVGSSNRGNKLQGRTRNFTSKPSAASTPRSRTSKSAGGGNDVNNYDDIFNSPKNYTIDNPVDFNKAFDVIKKSIFKNDKMTVDELLGAVGVLNNANVNMKYYRAGSNDIEVIIKIKAPYLVGTQQRSINYSDGEVYIGNDYFRVDPKYSGQGIGTKSLSRQVEFASKLGVDRIETFAAKSTTYNADGSIDKDKSFNGYYTWSRLGYDRKLTTYEKNLARNYYKKNISTVRDLFDIPDSGNVLSGAKWWKKNGSSGDMYFDLKSNSRSRKTLTEYAKKYFSQPEKNINIL